MMIGSGIATGMLLQRTIDNQRKAAAAVKTDRRENEKREKFLVFLGADVDMAKAFKHRIINIKER